MANARCQDCTFSSEVPNSFDLECRRNPQP